MNASADELRIRIMTSDDVAKADSLREAAGWNQLEPDWRRLLGYQPEGCFVAEAGGRLVGTVTTTSYGDALAWIGMMLVHPDRRRRGVGTALMRRALAFLQQERPVACIRLDATPLGRPVYERLGFVAEWDFSRWQRIDPDSAPRASAGSPDGQPNRRFAEGVVRAEIAGGRSNERSSDDDPLAPFRSLDREAFGVDRSEWLQRVAADSTCYLADDGFALTRPGRNAAYLGPIVARSARTASRLARSAGSQWNGPVVWDVPAANARAEQVASEAGFEPVRSLTRMRLGPADAVAPRLDLQFGMVDPGAG